MVYTVNAQGQRIDMMSSTQDPNPLPTSTEVAPSSVVITQPPAPAAQSTDSSVGITQPPAPAAQSTDSSVGIPQPPQLRDPPPAPVPTVLATEDSLLHPNTSTPTQSDNQSFLSGCRYVPIYL
jgi:hypothetical protein